MVAGHRCRACRQSHLKCNGAKPSCEKCTARGILCDYQTIEAKTPPAASRKNKLMALPTPSRTKDEKGKSHTDTEEEQSVSEEEFKEKEPKKPKFTRCIPCRKSHLGCDNLRPTCTQCLSKGKECYYRQYVLSS